MLEAIISAAAAIAVCMLNNIFQQKRAEKQHNTTIALIEYKLDQLTHKVELHNNAVERLYKAEQAIEIHKEQIKVANHRIGDLERS